MGKFTDTEASVECRKCEKGQFTPFIGMSKCGPCVSVILFVLLS